MIQNQEVFLNQFFVRKLDEKSRTVNSYSYRFTSPPEREDTFQTINRILWRIGNIPGAIFNGTIVTTNPIEENNLCGEGWTLQLIDKAKVLNPQNSIERKTLEQLFRKQLYQSLKQLSRSKVERSGRGLIWWDEVKIEQQGNGWQVLKGALLDVAIDNEGYLKLEIDTHYRFYSPWTVHQWLEQYPDIPLTYVHNLDSGYSWFFDERSDKRPDEVVIKDLGQTLAEYHRSKDVPDMIIKNSFVVNVKHTQKNKGQTTVPHLSQLLRPSISMDILSFIADKGETSAKAVITKTRRLSMSG